MIQARSLCKFAGLSLLSSNHKVEQPCEPWERVWKLNFVMFTQGAEISAKLHIGPAGSRIWPQIVRILNKWQRHTWSAFHCAELSGNFNRESRSEWKFFRKNGLSLEFVSFDRLIRSGWKVFKLGFVPVFHFPVPRFSNTPKKSYLGNLLCQETAEWKWATFSEIQYVFPPLLRKYLVK